MKASWLTPDVHAQLITIELKIFLPRRSSRYSSFMMNIIPNHLIWKSRCIGSANGKRQSSIKRSSQKLQHLSSFTIVREKSTVWPAVIKTSRIWMFETLNSRWKTIINNYRIISCKTKVNEGINIYVTLTMKNTADQRTGKVVGCSTMYTSASRIRR